MPFTGRADFTATIDTTSPYSVTVNCTGLTVGQTLVLIGDAFEYTGTARRGPVAMLVSALRDPLANLTSSSASTTVRTAILNQRAALDALLAQLDGGTP